MSDDVLAWLYVWTLERDENHLHMVQLWHRHPIISCFIKVQVGLIFLVSAYPGRPGAEAVHAGRRKGRKNAVLCLVTSNIYHDLQTRPSEGQSTSSL